MAASSAGDLGQLRRSGTTDTQGDAVMHALSPSVQATGREAATFGDISMTRADEEFPESFEDPMEMDGGGTETLPASESLVAPPIRGSSRGCGSRCSRDLALLRSCPSKELVHPHGPARGRTDGARSGARRAGGIGAGLSPSNAEPGGRERQEVAGLDAGSREASRPLFQVQDRLPGPGYSPPRSQHPEGTQSLFTSRMS